MIIKMFGWLTQRIGKDVQKNTHEELFLNLSKLFDIQMKLAGAKIMKKCSIS